MTLKEIKKEMIEYRDFYGGDLIDSGDIKSATTKKQLYDIIEKHRDHMEMMLRDADSHLDNFKERIGLTYI